MVHLSNNVKWTMSELFINAGLLNQLLAKFAKCAGETFSEIDNFPVCSFGAMLCTIK